MNLKRLTLITIVFLLNTIVIASTQAKTGYHIGDTGPDFTLKTLNGEKFSLTQLREKGHVLLIFWGVECVYCYGHIKDLNALHEKYHDKGLTVAAINIAGEYDPEVAEYVKDNGLKYLVLSDRLNNLDVAEAYHVVGYPRLVLISPEGKILSIGSDIPDVMKWIK